MIVLMSVPKEEGIPLNPNLTNKETKEANTAEAIADIIHFLPSLFASSFLSIITDTPTAKARWVLIYIHFQIYSKAYKTNKFI